MTKPVTAAAAMILVEECKLRLDDPVDGLPELADRQVLKRLDGPRDTMDRAHLGKTTPSPLDRNIWAAQQANRSSGEASRRL
jgi:hypothetical protein